MQTELNTEIQNSLSNIFIQIYQFLAIYLDFKFSSLKSCYTIKYVNNQKKIKMYQSPYTNIVNQIYHQFDTNRTGTLSVVELMNYYNAFNKANAIPFSFTQDLVHKCLLSLDQNYDQGICRGEYQTFFKNNLQGRTFNHIFYPYLCDRSDDNDLKGHIYNAFKQFDWDGSRKLNSQQLASFYNSIYRNAGILIEIRPNIAAQVLKIYGKDGLDAGDLFHHIRQFKTNPYVIPVC